MEWSGVGQTVWKKKEKGQICDRHAGMWTRKRGTLDQKRATKIANQMTRKMKMTTQNCEHNAAPLGGLADFAGADVMLVVSLSKKKKGK